MAAVETSTRPRVRIEIDLNSRDEFGRVPAYLEDANGYIAVGDTVTAFESEDEVAAPAVVKKIAHGVAYLDVDWSAMTDDVPAPVAHPASGPLTEARTSNSSTASWVPIKIKKAVTPLLISAAAVAAAATGGVVGGPAATAAPNSVSARDATTVTEAGELK
ncbi:hypothetical protein [Streptomyces scabiei]|uniref:hypothetical protein n=1 Tax=Streptomyces scabiei TaxID=1930 RepID=UPI001B3050D3|nr:hypothetical protein [Streptomyces sp. LBUM 1475]QTU64236.1 hypothetical protein F3K22_27360 [Streptomyces sp. LBUM 1475]